MPGSREEASVRSSGSFRAEVFIGGQRATDLYHGRDRKSNPEDVETLSITEQFRLGWQIDERWRIDLTVPRLDIETESDKSSETVEGLGDISFLASFSPWADSDGFLAGVSFFAGLKFPTGEEADEIDLTNPTPPSLLQEGTGTWDPIFGYRITVPLGEFRLIQSTATQITGGESDIGFEPGHVLLTRFGATVALWESVIPGLFFEGEFRAPDEIDGRDLGFTGSSIWSVTPSLTLRPLDRIELGIFARIPVYFNVRGTQLVPGAFIGISLAVNF